jgi:hypothetical protein
MHLRGLRAGAERTAGGGRARGTEAKGGSGHRDSPDRHQDRG